MFGVFLIKTAQTVSCEVIITTCRIKYWATLMHMTGFLALLSKIRRSKRLANKLCVIILLRNYCTTHCSVPTNLSTGFIEAIHIHSCRENQEPYVFNFEATVHLSILTCTAKKTKQRNTWLLLCLTASLLVLRCYENPLVHLLFFRGLTFQNGHVAKFSKLLKGVENFRLSRLPNELLLLLFFYARQISPTAAASPINQDEGSKDVRVLISILFIMFQVSKAAQKANHFQKIVQLGARRRCSFQ